jgi:hypothetical protein
LSQLRPGLRGAATSRAEAQVLRLCAIYAALDSTSIIGLPHLQAALAVWDYCYSSASLLFGTSTGDSIADRIREAIHASNDGLSKYQIRRLFHGLIEAAASTPPSNNSLPSAHSTLKLRPPEVDPLPSGRPSKRTNPKKTRNRQRKRNTQQKSSRGFQRL